MTQPGVWVGDAVRALRALRPGPDTVAEILDLLGLAPATPPARVAPVGLVPPPVRPVVAPPPGQPRTGQRESPVPAGIRNPVRRPAVAEPLPTRTAGGPPTRLPELAEVLPPPVDAVRLPPTGLLAPGRQRAIFSGLASTFAPSGELDVPAIVELLVAGRPLLTLPQLMRTTTRHGLQLLVDLGMSMVAFDRDQTEARQAIELVAGPDGLQVLNFHDTPLGPSGAGAGPVWDWTPYRPPTTPRPILVLSDLGLLRAGAAPTADWHRFATLCRDARCPVVALVPVPPARVPAALRRAITVVSWDRRTTVRDGATAARHAARPHRSRA